MTIDQAAEKEPKFHDVREVAGILRMSRMTVYRAIASGELAAVRVRGRWLVPAKVLRALEAKADTTMEAAIAAADEMLGGH